MELDGSRAHEISSRERAQRTTNFVCCGASEIQLIDSARELASSAVFRIAQQSISS
jgi:hypothetical protein